MLKEDNILNSRFGKKNHFQVPAGYFDQLTDRVMANLPEQEPRIDVYKRQGVHIATRLQKSIIM